MKRLLTIILCFTVIMNVSIETVKATNTNKSSVHKKYVAKIKAYNKKFCSELGDFNPQVYFRFYDLNHDGVDECVIVGTMFGDNANSIIGCGGTDVAIYTYYKGKVKKVAYSLTCGGTWGGIYFLKSKKADICSYDRAGSYYANYTFQKIIDKKGNLVDIGSANMSSNEDGSSPVYSINGTETSMVNYEDYIKKMSSNFKGIKMYKVTKKNLKKHI